MHLVDLCDPSISPANMGTPGLYPEHLLAKGSKLLVVSMLPLQVTHDGSAAG
jgi:hypothetical protein